MELILDKFIYIKIFIMSLKIKSIVAGILFSTFSSSIAFAEDPLHLKWLDKKVSPGSDFFSFANGSWLRENPIPADFSSWGSFSVLQEENRDKIHNMLVELSKHNNYKSGSIEQKVGDFYYSGMNIKSINKLGISPLNTEFSLINSIKNTDDLQNAIIHLHNIGLQVIFGFSSMQDFNDSTLVIGAIEQGGLSLPDRDYYLRDEEKFQNIRKEFVKHVTAMFMLLGDDKTKAQHKASVVMQIETSLAKNSMGRIETRDPNAVYHIMNINKLDELTPNFSWEKYFSGIGYGDIKEVNMAMPKFMQAVNGFLTSFSIDDWKTYLSWHLLDNSAAYLSQPFVAQNFKMAKIISGVQTLPKRWKRVVSTENAFLGFAVGQLFVEKYFSASDKMEVIKMIKNIRTVLKNDLKDLNWMTNATKTQAINKLDLLEERVGFPDKWRDYSALKIDRGPYILNILRCSAFLIKRDLDKIGKPVDRMEWEMAPQIVNAYYHPSLNSINIPMGILSPPYFDHNAPAAVNYGAIGVVIGHEITHGFDDQGSKFDALGNLHDWWSPEDLKKFETATQCIVQQYSKYKVCDNVNVQGKLVVGEATADLGGLILAYRAYLASDEYKHAKNINGYTPIQQFFISFAHIWADKIRPEQAINLATIDPHPPAKYRVNGTLANMPEFKQAFNLPDTSNMVNKNRCVIW